MANDLGLIGTAKNQCLRKAGLLFIELELKKNSRRISLDVSETAESFEKYRLSDVRTVELSGEVPSFS